MMYRVFTAYVGGRVAYFWSFGCESMKSRKSHQILLVLNITCFFHASIDGWGVGDEVSAHLRDGRVLEELFDIFVKVLFPVSF